MSETWGSGNVIIIISTHEPRDMNLHCRASNGVSGMNILVIARHTFQQCEYRFVGLDEVSSHFGFLMRYRRLVRGAEAPSGREAVTVRHTRASANSFQGLLNKVFCSSLHLLLAQQVSFHRRNTRGNIGTTI